MYIGPLVAWSVFWLVSQSVGQSFAQLAALTHCKGLTLVCPLTLINPAPTLVSVQLSMCGLSCHLQQNQQQNHTHANTHSHTCTRAHACVHTQTQVCTHARMCAPRCKLPRSRRHTDVQIGFTFQNAALLISSREASSFAQSIMASCKPWDIQPICGQRCMQAYGLHASQVHIGIGIR